MLYDILAACIPVFLFSIIGIIVVNTSEPEEDTKFEDIDSK